MVVFRLLGAEAMQSHLCFKCTNAMHGVWDNFPLKMDIHLTLQDIL